MKRIVILASGSGSNAENIIKYFQNSKIANVTHVLSNNEHAKVFDRCERLQIDASLFDKEAFTEDDTVLSFLQVEADIIILAGFLWRIPANIVAAFPNKIINIHPALLPKYGGKGMYGMNVHKAVKQNNETQTGITIHYVNENYDEGTIIFQAKTTLFPSDSAEDIAAKIHLLEQEHFPRVIEEVISKNG
ncbi:phosphoribosylglycinamide formyltransferase [Tenacibaculum piscium]|uniref:phosphoribosylglycinamide formyltransferase 1 n=1 Tax=Tenacibaculum piscium TaxID=1458515 RepID=A0A2H1YJM3_9FLAO|nr:phosphoribosylglycinamide formyltransferase [Tenacibaculum piscium]MBE7629490.1 phosphoribosylglycinamide formyltransferase [Tenacibaculum piscium]MBE7671361.1 phosphoribosylglycinamide formyltransferase [Tenacibaculum piscium]MBE7686146.1 phosphoribosylglycinamide formyltransferase [Tenacibaculum piscium]MBE7689883.1 phosphoribosylglycinamide formyltransferase [Tenacibaculum piscium]SOS75714.1 Phosphoribosylglycinamide formyltransferase [Tenacibaculum piscium]